MTAYDDLDRTLDAWFDTAPAPVAPPEGLARILKTTRGRRPRPSLVAGLGGDWVHGSARPSIRPVLVFALVALLALALVGAVALVGGRLVTPRNPLHAYTNELTSAPDLSLPMAHPALVPLLDGRVLVIGDDGDGGGTGTRALVYDPATGVSEPTGPLVSGWIRSALRLKDGTVLVIADADDDGKVVTQVFDPTTLRFAPTGPMITPRGGAAVALLADGKVLFAGGTPNGQSDATTSAELFDPQTSTFSTTGSMATSHVEAKTATLPDGRVFVSPGGSRLTAEVYDPSTATFSVAGIVSTYYRDHTAIALPDGRVAILGIVGMAQDGVVEVWDPTSRTFSPGPYMPDHMRSATLLDDGRILLIGGTALSWLRTYDPTAGVSTYRSTRAWLPGATLLADGRVLVVGGILDGKLRPEGGGTSAPGVSTVEIFQ